jgi:hypothetical protein
MMLILIAREESTAGGITGKSISFLSTPSQFLYFLIKGDEEEEKIVQVTEETISSRKKKQKDKSISLELRKHDTSSRKNSSRIPNKPTPPHHLSLHDFTSSMSQKRN